jgi:hypothetical protein
LSNPHLKLTLTLAPGGEGMVRENRSPMKIALMKYFNDRISKSLDDK